MCSIELISDDVDESEAEVISASLDSDDVYVDASGIQYRVYGDRAVRVFDQMETSDWFKVV